MATIKTILSVSNGSASTDGLVRLRGDWDASGGTLPHSSETVLSGYLYRINVAGYIPLGGGTVSLEVGTLLLARQDNPTSITHYSLW